MKVDHLVSDQQLLRHWANGLTLARALAGLPLILLLCWHQESLAWLLLLCGGMTDAADGWLARKAGGGSNWGARLDPLADKLLIAAPMLWLTSQDILPVWAVWMLIARELVISGWRSLETTGAPASTSGKAKTILQFICLLMLLWPPLWSNQNISNVIKSLGWWLFWPSLFMAMISAWNYINHQSKNHQY